MDPISSHKTVSVLPIEIYSHEQNTTVFFPRIVHFLKKTFFSKKNLPKDPCSQKDLFKYIWKIIQHKNTPPLSPEEFSEEAPSSHFFSHAVALYMSTAYSWETSQKITYLTALVQLGIRRHPICYSELGNCYKELHSWEKAALCYSVALREKKVSDTQLSLIELLSRNTIAHTTKALYLCDETTRKTVTTLEQISSFSQQNLWINALHLAQNGFDTSEIPVVFLQKLADIYISLSNQTSFNFLLQNFWPLAERVVSKIGQAHKTAWNEKSIQSVLQLIDYICSHHKEAKNLLLFLTKSTPYRNTTLDVFLKHLTQTYDNCWLILIKEQRRFHSLTERLIFSDFRSQQEKEQAAVLYTDLKEVFLGGRYQALPLGILFYTQQYAQFLQYIISQTLQQADPLQIRLYSPLFQSQAIKFASLHEEMKKSFHFIHSVLSPLFEWRNSRFCAKEPQEIVKSTSHAIAEGNLFVFIQNCIVPKNHAQNVLSYLETQDLSFEKIASSPVLSLVSSTCVERFEQMARIREFFLIHKISSAIDLKLFLRI